MHDKEERCSTMRDETVGLCILVHAEPKTGKTWLACTAPKPLLYLDVEGSSRFVPFIKRHTWKLGEPLPTQEQKPWDTAILNIRTIKEARRAYEYLRDANHPFRSVVIDTFSELQKRIIDESVGPDHKVEQSDWDVVLRQAETLCRQVRDLMEHPTHPLDCVCFTTHTWLKDKKQRPMVKGQFAITLPGFPDVLAYMYAATDDETGKVERRLAIQPVLPEWVAGDRTHVLTERLGSVIVLPEYVRGKTPHTLERMWRAINQPEVSADTKETTSETV